MRSHKAAAIITLILTGLLYFSATSHAQLAVKTNLLYDAMTTPNVGVEVGIGTKSTINMSYGINPWTFGSERHGDRKAKHWVLQPEYRYWLCSTFNGHFVGAHLMGGEMNVSNVALPVPGGFFSGENLSKGARNAHYQGGFAGLGLTYGYQWILDRHWNLEAEVGAGYNYVWYDKYRCGDCSTRLSKGHSNYLGLTKLGLSIMYIF